MMGSRAAFQGLNTGVYNIVHFVVDSEAQIEGAALSHTSANTVSDDHSSGSTTFPG
jgi:hypothetical protein